jgi:predicted metal-dependent phosphoesterase TrpH
VYVGLLLFVGAVLAGTALDASARARIGARAGHLLVADLHVHPFPGDGSLTIAQLQREATRRGIDVIAITGHNNRFGLALSSVLGTDPDGPIVIPGQEITSPGFHMAAVGIDRLVDWRLGAADAIAAVQAQGGVAIAAHPIGLIDAGWDDEARRALDGTEIMHPLRLNWTDGGRQLDVFAATTKGLNPELAVVGSTDFHMAAPLGLCRTYVLADDRSAAAVLHAIRAGRTAASCGGGDLVGTPENVAAVRQGLGPLAAAMPPSAGEKACAFLALAALAVLAWPSRR